MRINKYVAQATDLSRRAADAAIANGRVRVNGQPAETGQQIKPTDQVSLDNRPLILRSQTTTIMLHKPVGYVCSRDGQGSRTIYELLPSELGHLKPVGRLDKDTSGLLLMTDDGQLAHKLTHPSFHKTKVYEITLNKALQPLHRQMISEHGVMLEDGVSRLSLERLTEKDDSRWRVAMHEGRNRQIRRTFAALGYKVAKLHRTQFGPYHQGDLAAGKFDLKKI